MDACGYFREERAQGSRFGVLRADHQELSVVAAGAGRQEPAGFVQGAGAAGGSQGGGVDHRGAEYAPAEGKLREKAAGAGADGATCGVRSGGEDWRTEPGARGR